ncbi:MAG: DUF6920 family protein [Tangfeifania sp.]
MAENKFLVDCRNFRPCYRGNEPEAKRREWIITVKETKNLNGFRIPVKMESTWMLEDGPWTWLNLEVTEIEYNCRHSKS